MFFFFEMGQNECDYNSQRNDNLLESPLYYGNEIDTSTDTEDDDDDEYEDYSDDDDDDYTRSFYDDEVGLCPELADPDKNNKFHLYIEVIGVEEYIVSCTQLNGIHCTVSFKWNYYSNNTLQKMINAIALDVWHLTLHGFTGYYDVIKKCENLYKLEVYRCDLTLVVQDILGLNKLTDIQDTADCFITSCPTFLA